MKVVFMGTPDFAAVSLQKLIDEKYNIAAVFTQPDKPKGRGYQLLPPPVKQLAITHNIPVYQPATLKDEKVQQLLTEMAPDIIIVAAYGKILPLSVLSLPPLGCVNVHASLLPAYRGAGPIQWCIINGERETGITIMYMEEGLDTGDMLLQRVCKIGENETYGQLQQRLAVLGGEALIEVLHQIESGNTIRKKQDSALSCYAPMIDKQIAVLDFHKSAQQVHNLIRGLSPTPCAQTTLAGQMLKVYSSILHPDLQGQPGEILDEKRFIVACANGAVEFTSVQLQGKKRLDTKQFLCGYKLKSGSIL